MPVAIITQPMLMFPLLKGNLKLSGRTLEKSHLHTIRPHEAGILLTVVDWFSLYRSSPFLGLRNLGLLNIFFTFLSIPLMYALYAAHRRTHRAFAGLSLIAALLGVAVFLAGNRAFPMLELSSWYTAAGDDARRSLLAAAGEAMLAAGQSHTPGTFLAFFLSTLAGMGISVVMLRARLFSNASAVIGIVGFCS
jgi:hypothetical protein